MYVTCEWDVADRMRVSGFEFDLYQYPSAIDTNTNQSEARGAGTRLVLSIKGKTPITQ